MKKYLKKLFAGIMALAIIAVSAIALPAVPAKAATSVTIFFQNTQNWSQVYCYTFNGTSGTSAAWPGTKMTDAGNGWFKFTYTGDKGINCVFDDNATPKAKQTLNCSEKDLPTNASAYWFVPVGGDQKGSDGMNTTGVNITVYKAAPAGAPAAPAAGSTDTKSSGSGTAATATTANATDSSPKTGDNNIIVDAAIILGMFSFVSVCALIGKKKKTQA